MKMRMKTKVGKAAELLRRAVRAMRSKAGVLGARLLFLASLRRRTAMVGAVSRHVRALMQGRHGKAAPTAVLGSSTAEEGNVGDERVPPDALHGVDVAGLSELLQQVVDDDDGGRYPDWTHSLFDDDDGIDGDDDDEEERGGGEAVEEDLADDEPSVIDVIRSRREGDGVEFIIEEDIDHAADMFIRRVRSRMNNRSF